MTADVTQLHPPLVHYDSCNRDHADRVVELKAQLAWLRGMA